MAVLQTDTEVTEATAEGITALANLDGFAEDQATTKGVIGGINLA